MVVATPSQISALSQIPANTPVGGWDRVSRREPVGVHLLLTFSAIGPSSELRCVCGSLSVDEFDALLHAKLEYSHADIDCMVCYGAFDDRCLGLVNYAITEPDDIVKLSVETLWQF